MSIATIGCGDSAGRPSGKVLHAGTPVAGAELLFAAQAEGKTVAISGITGDDGAYVLDYSVYDGVPVGAVEITVTRAVTREGASLPPGEEGAALVQSGRARTEVTRFAREIPAGPSVLDFELTEGRKEGS